MQLSDLIARESVVCDLKSNSKKQFLQDASAHAAEALDIPARLIFDTLTARERDGSTGIGNGIALPHGRIAGLGAISAFFFRLARPIEFDSMDDQPADLMFLLLTPDTSGPDHLKALARLARVMREPHMLQHLREAEDADALHALLTRERQPKAA